MSEDSTYEELREENRLLKHKLREQYTLNLSLVNRSEDIEQSREWLHKSKELDLVLEALPVGVAVSTPEGKVRRVNQKFIDLFGYELSDIPDIYQWFKLAYPDKAYREAAQKRWENEIEAYNERQIPGFNPVHAEVHCKDGSKRFIEFGYEQIGETLLTTFSDITQLRKSQAHLLELNAMKDKLFSIIAHDLKSPFNNIITLLKLMQNHNLSEKEFKVLIRDLSKNVGYTAQLLQNLLLWAKSQMEDGSVRTKEFPFHEVVRRNLTLFDKNAEEKGINLTARLTDLQAYADADMIDLVVRNLISNAIKFTRRQGKIDIRVEKEHRCIYFSIKDNGIGISEKQQKTLFGKEMLSSRGTMNEKGTGLGLRLCKDFVEKNGGSIGYKSRRGEGTHFYFRIPVVE